MDIALKEVGRFAESFASQIRRRRVRKVVKSSGERLGDLAFAVEDQFRKVLGVWNLVKQHGTTMNSASAFIAQSIAMSLRGKEERSDRQGGCERSE